MTSALPPFRNPALLTQALTHRSYVNEHAEAGPDNERLEFLGDAALDFICGQFLFHTYPDLDEAQMTRLRNELVRTETLARLALQFNLGSRLLLGKGEEAGDGRRRYTNLCAAFEAVLGAYLLDSGYEAVRGFVEPLLARLAADLLREDALRDPKSQLQEWAQANGHHRPIYRVIGEYGPDHEKEFTVEVRVGEDMRATGRGSNKAIAQQAAAQAALEKIARMARTTT